MTNEIAPLPPGEWVRDDGSFAFMQRVRATTRDGREVFRRTTELVNGKTEADWQRGFVEYRWDQ